jgi:amino acid exporter
METNLHSVLMVVTLFFFGLISPGPNFFVVTEAALNFGRAAGFATGLGAALGDAVYASVGLFGVTRLIAHGQILIEVEILGGLYLTWLGARMFSGCSGRVKHIDSLSVQSTPAQSHFWHGLGTDLANPKTVVFFASIFAVTVHADSSPNIRGAMLCGIVLTSLVWRFLLSIIFSTSFIRNAYLRSERFVERAFGAALCLFGALLVKRAVC